MTHTGRAEIGPGRLPLCCAAIAGLLAEHAIILVSLERAGEIPRTLHARQTDLPGELLRAIPCVLHVGSPSRFELRLSPAGIDWTTDDDALATSLACALQ